MVFTLEIENFKGIKKTPVIEFGPLNIIAGANGAGKSSILQALLFLKQSLTEPHDKDPLPYRFKGSQVWLRSFQNLVYNKELENDIRINLGCRFHKDDLSQGNKQLASGRSKIKEILNIKKFSDLGIDFLSVNFNLVITACQDEDGDFILSHPGEIGIEINRIDSINSKKTKGLGFYKLSGIESLYSSGSADYEENQYSGRLIGINKDGKKEDHQFDLFSIKALKIEDAVSSSDEADIMELARRCKDDFNTSIDIVRRLLESWDYLEAIRTKAKSSYRRSDDGGKNSKVSANEIGPSGNNAPYAFERLKASQITERYQFDFKTQAFRKRKNSRSRELGEWMADWLRHFSARGFESNQEKNDDGDEVILKLDSQNTDKNVKVSLADTGIGYSQLFPVLLKGLSSPTATSVIFDQPDAHLHFKYQKAVADFFVYLVLNGINITVETHSVPFIDRIVRRAVEKVRIYSKGGKVKSIDHNNYSIPDLVDRLNIYYIESGKDGSRVHKIGPNDMFDKYGDFFYLDPSDSKEIYLHNQMSKKKS